MNELHHHIGNQVWIFRYADGDEEAVEDAAIEIARRHNTIFSVRDMVIVVQVLTARQLERNRQ